MRKLSGEALTLALVIIAGGIYILYGLKMDSPRKIAAAAAAISLIIEGLLLLARFRWSAELIMMTLILMGIWTFSRFFTDGFKWGRVLATAGLLLTLSAYPRLRDELRPKAG